MISSNAKTAMGLVGVPLVVGDEPGAWETVGGELMADALTTAQGKPESSLRAILIGTRAPAARGWWIDLLAGGSEGSSTSPTCTAKTWTAGTGPRRFDGATRSCGGTRSPGRCCWKNATRRGVTRGSRLDS